MNYHNILHDDMRNGTGLRVTLFLSGCNHYCHNCQNPQTWDPNSGVEFDLAAKEEIFEQLNKDYIAGITITGGDPLYKENVDDVLDLCENIKKTFPNKTIWIYTGSTWEEILESRQLTKIIINVDVVVDGCYMEEFSDIKYHWAGSTNQRIINVKKSLKQGEIVLWDTN